MKWSNKRGAWSVSIRNIGGNPGSVVVAGVEGMEMKLTTEK